MNAPVIEVPSTAARRIESDLRRAIVTMEL
jgi:hypothetical protein